MCVINVVYCSDGWMDGWMDVSYSVSIMFYYMMDELTAV